MWVNSGICCLLAQVRKGMVNRPECQHDDSEYSAGGVEAEWRNHRLVATGWWHPMEGCSPSEMPGSTVPPAARPSLRPSSALPACPEGKKTRRGGGGGR